MAKNRLSKSFIKPRSLLQVAEKTAYYRVRFTAHKYKVHVYIILISTFQNQSLMLHMNTQIDLLKYPPKQYTDHLTTTTLKVYNTNT
jgi:hypothetical protein